MILQQLIDTHLNIDLDRFFNQKLRQCLVNTRQYPKLIQKTSEQLQHNPYDTESAEALTQVTADYPEGIPQIIEILQGLSEKNPHLPYFLDYTAFCHEKLGNMDSAALFRQKAREARFQYLNPVTQENFRNLARLLSEKGILAVMVPYPLRSIGSVERLSSEENLHIRFVDNEESFKKAVLQESYEDYFSDKFAGDFGHCTSKGNHLLAQNVAKIILKEFGLSF